MLIRIRLKYLLAAASVLTAALIIMAAFKHVSEEGGILAATAPLGKTASYTVVLDPGHGGADGGASSSSGVLESTLNLEIAERVEAVLLLFGQPVRMTRSSETLDYPPDAQTIKAKKNADTHARVELIEATDHALLLSIHQNFYPAAGPSGAQVLYAPTAGSQSIAERLQASLLEHLDAGNRREAAPIQKSIYIMNHVSCPAVLVECGFLSNPSEAALLCTKEYQIKLAAILSASILPHGGIYES